MIFDRMEDAVRVKSNMMSQPEPKKPLIKRDLFLVPDSMMTVQTLAKTCQSTVNLS